MEQDEGQNEWLELLQRLNQQWPLSPDMPIAEERRVRRRIADTLAAATADPVDDGARIHEFAVEAGGWGGFVRIYEPWRIGDNAPTQLFLHGGGFVHGSTRELVNDSLLAARAVATGIRIVSFEYPLAPEHPFPAARDATVALLAELVERAPQLGIDVGRLGLGGNSAGASVAASAALRLAAEDRQTIHHLLLEVPAVSLAKLDAFFREHPEYAQEYAAILAHYRPALDGSAFVADAAELRGFPSTLLMLAEADPVTEGGLLLADRLRAVDVPVRAHVVPGTSHATPGITRISTQAMQWRAIVDGELRTAYRTQEPEEETNAR
ncbi:alpha/beta hydrolase [Arthrobacter sp. NPDC090010]|uniref:alpha/beta hydrolase n=1 Tax=Arthrobacter sp. NPDC090010 TaxID=3363942 RepID=UPI00381AE346